MTLDIALFIPLTTALTEVVKRVGLPIKYIPILSIIIGISFAILSGLSPTLINNVIMGLIIGLSASGLFSFGKKPIQKILKKITV